ncbi:glycoprotein [Estrildid finch bornavirus 1]|uniref:Glycoprotein n=1 Tax=Estrildid finch bornavirus 1 TaxID=1715295 RepID=V9XLY5_9MONO|nr:glycoprotein [Estrildid finch bornavirus 1]AHD24431.1 glycoprotein [Estrildid finch bornavirus 1]
MQHLMSSHIAFGILVWGLLDLTFALTALKCNTDSTPTLIDLDIRRLCHNRTDHVVSCEVSYRNHTVLDIRANHVSCFKYHCKTYWGFFGSYSSDRLINRYLGDASLCSNETKEDPFVCNWYYCCTAQVTEICRCTTNNVTIAVKTFPPFVYCSFADCSTVNERDLAQGRANLSDGSYLLFSNLTISSDWTNGTFNGTILCNSTSSVVSIDAFRRAYPLRNCTYTSETLNITCQNCSEPCRSRRRKRDLPEMQYLVHKLRPTLADAWEDCEILQSLILGIFGSGMTGSSQFLREWLNHSDIVGYIVRGIGVVWQCHKVNISFLPWNESTYYPPVNASGERLYLNDEGRLQTNTPEARPGLKRIFWHEKYYLGTVGSDIKPKRVKYNRTSHDYHLSEFEWALNITPSINIMAGHETNPINHAYGTQSDLLPYTRSSNITSTDTGSGWVHIGLPSFAFINPLGWIRDIMSWAAWIGGILYLITLCISLPALFVRRRRLGRWRE